MKRPALFVAQVQRKVIRMESLPTFDPDEPRGIIAELFKNVEQHLSPEDFPDPLPPILRSILVDYPTVN